jgi:hypothetical protein
MEDYDEFNIIYILKIIEDTHIYVISPIMFNQRNRPLGVKEGGFVK